MRLEAKDAALLSGIVRDTSRTTGIQFFRTLVRSLASLLKVRYAMVTECIDSPPTRVQTLAFWAADTLVEDFEYSVFKTPCEKVVLGESRSYGRDLQALYPEDEDLKTLGVESYAATPIFSGDGRVIGHLLIMDSKPIDEVTANLGLLEIFAERAAAEMERTRVTAALENSQAQLRQVIDLVPHFIFAKDQSGQFILANRSLADAYGTTVDELIGKTDADFNSSEEEVGQFRRDDLEVIESGEIKVIDEETITDAAGRQRILQTTKIPFTSASSDSPSMLGVAIDITRQSLLEEQRQALQQQVLHAQKMESLGVLAGGLAHDFNNLLTSILGNVDLAAESLSAAAPEQEYIAEIALAARHSAELAGQMLAYSGKGSFVFTRVDLNHLIQETSELLKRSVSKKARLDLELEPDLPPLSGDLIQLRQVVMNLIINASDALEGGRGKICIRTGRRMVDRESFETTYLGDAVNSGEFILLEVEDDGCGMNAETLERLFDPFFTTKSTGRGLGLSALLGIVRSHGGTVQVDSQLGRGTTFRVLLATGISENAGKRSESPIGSKKIADDIAASRHATILVADDEELVLRVTRLLLEKQGLRVLTAVDGEDALRVFKRHQSVIDAVLLDITMPNLDGIETLKELRALDPAVKVLLASGYAQEAVIGLRTGEPVGFLKKPYRAAELERELRKVLGWIR